MFIRICITQLPCFWVMVTIYPITISHATIFTAERTSNLGYIYNLLKSDIFANFGISKIQLPYKWNLHYTLKLK